LRTNGLFWVWPAGNKGDIAQGWIGRGRGGTDADPPGSGRFPAMAVIRASSEVRAG